MKSCCFYPEHATGAMQVNPVTYLHFQHRSIFTDVVLYPAVAVFRGLNIININDVINNATVLAKNHF